MLGKETLLLHLDDIALATLLLSLELLLLKLCITLGLVDDEFLLPQALDLTLVLQLTHAALLSIHLLQALVLRELLHQLALELFLHADLFLGALGLEPELVLTSRLELFSNADALLSLGPLFVLSRLFTLLNVQLVAKLLLELLLGSPLFLLSSELLEDAVTNGLCFFLHRLDLVLTCLLLLGVPAHHLVFVLVHLTLAFHQRALLVLRKDHVGLRLLFLLLDDAGLFVVLFNHALDNRVNLTLLPHVLVVSLLAEKRCVVDLFLDFALVVAQLIKFALILAALKLVANLLVLQHRHVDLGVFFDINLCAELLLSHLLRTLFVQIGGLDLSLQIL